MTRRRRCSRRSTIRFRPTRSTDTGAGDTLAYAATQSDDSVSALVARVSSTPRESSRARPCDGERMGTVEVQVTSSDCTDSVSDEFDIVGSAGTTTATGTGMCLVSNLNQVASNNRVLCASGSTTYSHDQGFTTGANIGIGYTLTSIRDRVFCGRHCHANRRPDGKRPGVRRLGQSTHTANSGHADQAGEHCRIHVYGCAWW